MLLKKPRSYAEIYNDLDGEIVNLFKMVRDRGNELLSAIELTPFSRDEFKQSYEPHPDPLEQARRTVLRSFQGFGSAAACGEISGFRANSNRSGTTPAHDWRNYPNHIPDFIERLRGVVIENRDALDLMKQHDGENVLHYVDPPYVHSTRSEKTRGTVTRKAYKYEMTDDDHVALAELLNNLHGKVVLSGYRSDLYDELYRDWQKIERHAHADGAVDRIECLWLSPNSAQIGLF